MVLAVDTHAAQGWSPVAEGQGQHLAWLVGWALLWKAPPGSVEAALGVTGKEGKPRSPSRLGSAHPQHSKSLGAVSLSQLGHEIIRTSWAWARAAPGSPSETRTVTSQLCRPDSRVPTAPEASPSVLSRICSFPPHRPQAQSSDTPGYCHRLCLVWMSEGAQPRASSQKIKVREVNLQHGSPGEGEGLFTFTFKSLAMT